MQPQSIFFLHIPLSPYLPLSLNQPHSPPTFFTTTSLHKAIIFFIIYWLFIRNPGQNSQLIQINIKYLGIALHN